MPLPRWVEEVEERVKDAWQHYGDFLPIVQTSVRKLGQNALEQRFALTFHVTSGRQYKLDDVRISGAKLFSPEVVRSFFDLQAGDIFDTQVIRAGIESLRSGYNSHGYINFVAVPSTRIDENHRRIFLLLDI